MLGPSNMISLIAMASSIKRTCILSLVLNRVLREREGIALHRVGLLKYFFALKRIRISSPYPRGTPVLKHGSSTHPPFPKGVRHHQLLNQVQFSCLMHLSS